MSEAHDSPTITQTGFARVLDDTARDLNMPASSYLVQAVARSRYAITPTGEHCRACGTALFGSARGLCAVCAWVQS